MLNNVPSCNFHTLNHLKLKLKIIKTLEYNYKIQEKVLSKNSKLF